MKKYVVDQLWYRILLSSIEGFIILSALILTIVCEAKNLDYSTHLLANIALLIIIFISDCLINAFCGRHIYCLNIENNDNRSLRYGKISIISATFLSVAFWILRTVLYWSVNEKGIVSVLVLIFLITITIFVIFWFMFAMFLISSKIATGNEIENKEK